MIYLMKLLTILSYFPPSITPSPSPISTNHDLSSDTNADILSSNVLFMVVSSEWLDDKELQEFRKKEKLRYIRLYNKELGGLNDLFDETSNYVSSHQQLTTYVPIFHNPLLLHHLLYLLIMTSLQTLTLIFYLLILKLIMILPWM